MADFYTELQGVAAEILDEFSQGTIVLTRITPGTPDPATPWIPVVDTTTDFTLKATVRGVSQNETGNLILETDEVVVSSADIVTPILSDTITVDGKPRALKKIRPVPAAGTPVAFNIFIAG